MNYRDWQRQHRDWPLRMKDLVTNKRRVKLVCDKLTVSNKMHRAGDIYTVVGVYRGRLSLGGHAGQTKTYDDTNMLMAACLPMPYLFELENVFLSLGSFGDVQLLRESFKSAALTIEFGWHYLAMKAGLWYVPENPMETIVQVERKDRRRTNWELREPCKLMKVGAKLGQSQVLTANVKWAPEFKATLPPCRLRVALVGSLIMPVGYWEYPKEDERCQQSLD